MVRQVDAIDPTSSSLSDLIAERIVSTQHQRITFAEYMDLALYHPQQGYYATRALTIGPQGDFFTAPHLGPDFGELLAEQFVQMWEILHCPDPFTIVEMGAGQGLLAADLLRYLLQQHPDFFRCIDYVIVERVSTLVAQQQQQLQEATASGARLSWKTFADIPPNSVTGCFFSNELVDALPVHQFMIESGQLQEVYVTALRDEQQQVQFKEVVGELSCSQLAEYFQLVEVEIPSARYPNHYRSEINLAALDWISTVANRLRQGYLVTIDYGYPSDRYYNPARAQGTLQCYYRHAHHSDPYIHVGQQDITAHVDFTALERQGDRAGLQSLGLTQQGLFLMALGLGERIAAVGQSETTDRQEIQIRLQRRDALHRLVNPMGLGSFGVLIQSKGIETSTRLTGLSYPSM